MKKNVNFISQAIRDPHAVERNKKSTLLSRFQVTFHGSVVSQRVPGLEQLVANVASDAVVLDVPGLNVVGNVALVDGRLAADAADPAPAGLLSVHQTGNFLVQS